MENDLKPSTILNLSESKHRSINSEVFTPNDMSKTINYFPSRKKRERRNAFKDLRPINNFIHIMPI